MGEGGEGGEGWEREVEIEIRPVGINKNASASYPFREADEMAK